MDGSDHGFARLDQQLVALRVEASFGIDLRPGSQTFSQVPFGGCRRRGVRGAFPDLIDKPLIYPVRRVRVLGKDVLIGPILLRQHRLDDGNFPLFEGVPAPASILLQRFDGLIGGHDLVSYASLNGTSEPADEGETGSSVPSSTVHVRDSLLKSLVGVKGFEPSAPGPRDQCSTRLSYTPTVRAL